MVVWGMVSNWLCIKYTDEKGTVINGHMQISNLMRLSNNCSVKAEKLTLKDSVTRKIKLLNNFTSVNFTCEQLLLRTDRPQYAT